MEKSEISLSESPGDRANRDETEWIFGYGSLIWRPDFPWLEWCRATIPGWARRFWQGSHDHRGRPDAPGRVVTLIRAEKARCAGIAYRIDRRLLEHLDYREKNGYERVPVILTLSAPAGTDRGGKPAAGGGGARCVPGVVYIAHPGNRAFLGPAPVADMADQIRHASGPSGSNFDYLVHLANALRQLDIHDRHVFALEAAVLKARGSNSQADAGTR